MEFKSIPASRFKKAIDSLENSDYAILSLTLINGITIYGKLPPNEPISNGNFNLYIDEQHNEHIVSVPLRHIAGMIPLSYTQEGEPVSNLVGYNGEVVELWLNRWTLRVAEKCNYEVEEQHFVYNLSLTQQFNRGPVVFEGDTPLYCDWDFLSKKEGGLDSLGVSAFGFGLSAGWSDNLWSSFEDAISETETNLLNIPESSEVTVSGYVDFLEEGDEIVSETMEGAEWLASVITNQRVSDIAELDDEPWTVCYFRNDSFHFPQRYWDKMEQSINIYGEVVQSPFETEFGKARCYLKARAAAFLSE